MLEPNSPIKRQVGKPPSPSPLGPSGPTEVDRWLPVRRAVLAALLLISEGAFSQSQPPAQSSSAPEPLRVIIEKTSAEEAGEKVREAKTDEHERLDLIAQQQSAQAAQLQLWISGATLVISAIGGALLLATWVETKRGARATERSAALAHRAWLRVDVDLQRVVAHDSEGRLMGYPTLTLRNVGSTPALDVWTHCEAHEMPVNVAFDPSDLIREARLRIGTVERPRHSGKAVFPEQELVDNSAFILKNVAAPESLSLIVVVVAQYRFLGDEEMHSTATACLVEQAGVVPKGTEVAVVPKMRVLKGFLPTYAD